MISKLTWTCKTGQDGACAMVSCSCCCCQVNIQWSVAGNSIGSLVTLQKYIDSLLVPSRAERSSCFQLLCLLTISWHLIQSRRINQFINGRLDNENNLFNVVLEVFFSPSFKLLLAHANLIWPRVVISTHTCNNIILSLLTQAACLMCAFKAAILAKHWSGNESGWAFAVAAAAWNTFSLWNTALTWELLFAPGESVLGFLRTFSHQ